VAGTQRHKQVGGRLAEPREGTKFLSDVIGKNVAAARAFVSLSQLDLADRMTKLGHGWYGSTVGRVEKGTRVVTAEELIGLALALHPITPYYLLSPISQGPVGAADIDLGPDIPLPLLPSSRVDRMFRARRKTLASPPLVIWEGNEPKAWTPTDGQGRLHDLIRELLDLIRDLEAEEMIKDAAKLMVAGWDSKDVLEAVESWCAGNLVPGGRL